MKQKDLAVLIVVAVVSAIASLLISKQFFTTAQDRSQKVEVIDKITSDFATPDNKYFNSQSVNPAQLVQIGQDNNQDPFGKSR